MLFNLLDAAIPTPIDILIWMYEENPLYIIIPIAVLLLSTILIIALSVRSERKADKRNREHALESQQQEDNL
jgi:hypothetical protein